MSPQWPDMGLADLLRQARDLGINLSEVLEEALERIVRRRLAEKWL